MRILHVITGLEAGGAERFLSMLAPCLAARGFEQSVVSLSGLGPAASQLKEGGIPVAALGARGPLTTPLALARLARIVRQFAPHAIQGWMYHGDLFGTVARAISGSGRSQLYWGVRCSDMNLDDYTLQLRLVVRACAGLSAHPYLIIANSEAGARVHAAAGYRPRNWTVIPNGIDTSRFRPDAKTRHEVRAELGLAQDTPVIMHVARVDPMKDHATMIAAATDIEGAVTVLVGKGTESYARPPGIIALGARDDVERVLTAGDLIVSSSAYGEGFSNAIAEGMAAGLVPVATDVGDARVIVGDTGAIVRTRLPAELASAIRAILVAGPEERAVRGAAARQRIASEFSLRRAADRFEAVYRGASGEQDG